MRIVIADCALVLGVCFIIAGGSMWSPSVGMILGGVALIFFGVLTGTVSKR